MTLALELAGAALLALHWWPTLGSAAPWYGPFHSVSAFNNAGFALWSDSLSGWRGDAVVNGVVTALIIAGRLGFFVLAELGRNRRTGMRLSVHTTTVLSATALLLAAGTVATFALESNNPQTLGGLPFSEQLLGSWFHSVASRTAGFNTLDVPSLTEATLFGTVFLMFVGASPGGTGGGVKTTTFSIAAAALWATLRGHREPTLSARPTSPESTPPSCPSAAASRAACSSSHCCRSWAYGKSWPRP